MRILSINLLAHQSKSLSSNFWRSILSLRGIQTKAYHAGDLKHVILKNDDDDDYRRHFLVDRAYCGNSYISLLSTKNFEEYKLYNAFTSKFPDPPEVGYCDGLLFMCNRYLSILSLWNPKIDEYKSLPSSPVILQSSLERCCKCCGFGFDLKSEDYKIIIHYLDHDCLTELYSLKTDSWKTISSHPDCSILIEDNYPSVYMNGFYYWASSEGPIITFDFGSEIFSSIPLPDPDKLEGPYTYNLLDFDGKLAAVVYPYSLSVTGNVIMPFDIWVWSDESWTRSSVIEAPSVARRLLGFWGNDKFLIECQSRTSFGHRSPASLYSELVIFDRVTQELKNLGIYADAGKMQIYPYVETSFPLYNGT